MKSTRSILTNHRVLSCNKRKLNINKMFPNWFNQNYSIHDGESEKNGKYLKELYRTCGYTLLSVVKSLFLLFIVDIHHVTNLVHSFLKTYSFNHHVSHFSFNLTRIRKCHVTQLLFRTKESWDILEDEETRVTKSRLASGLHFVGVRIKASSIG